jgi:hypothetical protein
MKGWCTVKKNTIRLALLSVVATVLLTLSAIATFSQSGCPFVVNCEIDGAQMYKEGCEINKQTWKTVCRFGHDHTDFDGRQVHHYVYIECD